MRRPHAISAIAVAVLLGAIGALSVVLAAEATDHAWVTPPILGVSAAGSTALILLALALGLYATQDQKLDSIGDQLEVLAQLPAVVERAEGTVDDLRTVVAAAIFGPQRVAESDAGARVTRIRPRRS